MVLVAAGGQIHKGVFIKYMVVHERNVFFFVTVRKCRKMPRHYISGVLDLLELCVRTFMHVSFKRLFIKGFINWRSSVCWHRSVGCRPVGNSNRSSVSSRILYGYHLTFLTLWRALDSPLLQSFSPLRLGQTWILYGGRNLGLKWPEKYC